MVGINRGNLGFLTRIETTDLEKALEALVEGSYRIEERLLLKTDGGVKKPQAPLAVNDVVIKSSKPSQLIRMQVLIEGQPVAMYDADGLIISTPTGSTAYNLAAGGPVVSPSVKAIALTPICPHSLSAKPVLIPSHETLTVELIDNNHHGALCSVDGRDIFELAPGEQLSIQEALSTLKLVQLNQEADNFYWLLSQKLHWAENPRRRLRSST